MCIEQIPPGDQEMTTIFLLLLRPTVKQVLIVAERPHVHRGPCLVTVLPTVGPLWLLPEMGPGVLSAPRMEGSAAGAGWPARHCQSWAFGGEPVVPGWWLAHLDLS